LISNPNQTPSFTCPIRDIWLQDFCIKPKLYAPKLQLLPAYSDQVKNTDDEQHAELMKKLDLVIRLLASSMVQGKSLTEQATLLSSMGLETKDIAGILRKDPKLISQTLYQAKQSKKSQKVT
jgi:hypothetical protein